MWALAGPNNKWYILKNERELQIRQDIKALININNRRISVEDRQEGKLQRESSATKQYDAGELWCHRTLLGKGIKGQSALEMHIKVNMFLPDENPDLEEVWQKKKLRCFHPFRVIHHPNTSITNLSPLSQRLLSSSWLLSSFLLPFKKGFLKISNLHITSNQIHTVHKFKYQSQLQFLQWSQEFQCFSAAVICILHKQLIQCQYDMKQVFCGDWTTWKARVPLSYMNHFTFFTSLFWMGWFGSLSLLSLT